MKGIKKIVTLLLVMAMTFTMVATAFATDSTQDAGKGTITVQNAIADKEYVAYKIFDVTYNGEGQYAYTIKANSDWLTVVDGYAGITLVESYDGSFHTATFNGNYSAAAFADALKAGVTSKTGVELNVSGGQATANNLELGFYFVTSTAGALCNLTTTDPDAVIRDKNDMPFDKVDDDDSVEVGQVVHYTITGKVPDTTGFTAYTYKVTDIMTAGLTFKKDVAVTINGTAVTVTPDYTTNNGFELNIPMLDADGKALYTAGATIKITYSAIVNETAVGVISENKAVLTYSNNPTDPTATTSTPEDVEKVYSAKIVIDKVAAGDTNKKLEGAKFVLKNAAGKFYAYDATNKDVSWVDAQDDATVVTTDANGAAEFIGLEDGTYNLKEIKAPLGYNLLKDEISVTVAGNTTDASLLTVETQVKNNAGLLLPETGGIGTTLFYTIGGLLVVAAVVLLIGKRRENDAK